MSSDDEESKFSMCTDKKKSNVEVQDQNSSYIENEFEHSIPLKKSTEFVDTDEKVQPEKTEMAIGQINADLQEVSLWSVKNGLRLNTRLMNGAHFTLSGLDATMTTIAIVEFLKQIPSNHATKNHVRDLHKESQRIIREANISVPYHKPKQRTLEEFRKRIKCAPTIFLHTSVDDLVSVWKAIEEREKLVESFYRSESSDDSDDSNDNVNKTMPTSDDPAVSCAEAENMLPGFRDQLPPDFSCPKNDDTSKSVSTSSNDVIEKTTTLSSICDIIVNKVSTTVNVDNSNERSLTIGDRDVSNHSQISCEKVFDNRYKSVEKKGFVNKDVIGLNTIEQNPTSVFNSLIKENYKNKIGTNVSLSSDCNTLSNVNEEIYSLRLSESQLNHQSSQTGSKLNKNGCNESQTDRMNIEQLSSESIMNVNMSNSLLQNIEGNNTVGQASSISKSKDSDLSNLKTHCKEDQTNQISSKIDSITSCVFQNDSSHLNHTTNINISDETSKPISSEISHLHSFQSLDLEEEVIQPKVNSLMKRFYTHLTYKTKKDKNGSASQLSGMKNIIDYNSINEEKVLIPTINDNGDKSHINKPGTKLTQLKVHLKSMMARQRKQEWLKREKDHNLYEEEICEGNKNDDGKDECEFNDDENDRIDSETEISEEEEEEEEDADVEDEEEEEEINNEFGDRKKSKRKLHVFIDNEAEDSDENEVPQVRISHQREDFNKYSMQLVDKKDDDDDGKQDITNFKNQSTNLIDVVPSVHFNCTNKDADEELPSYQEPLPLGEKVEELEESECSSNSLSPAFRLTALEGKDERHYQHSEPSTPNKDFLCPKAVTPVGALHQLVNRSPFANSQELEDLCSGQFVSQSLPLVEDNTSQDYNEFHEDLETSQDPPTQDTGCMWPETSQKLKHSRQIKEDDSECISKLKNRNVKKLTYSDDENSDNDEEINKNEEDSLVKDLDRSDVNEVMEEAEQFFEKEAELSESEWESEDEDELGLDTLEMEEADKEQIDQNKLKNQLNQIHMKQLLIEDKKEVRILQEMLLEDGELHSDGKRQRCFRWSNNAFSDGTNTALHDSDDDKTDEDDEETWRRWRHEREQFLRKHTNNVDRIELAIDESSTGSLKIGQKSLKQKNINTWQDVKATPAPISDMLTEPNIKLTDQPKIQRGSYLTRGSKILSQLAQNAANGSESTINLPKNTRNFVFTSISPSKDCEQAVIQAQEARKRKMTVLPLPIAKKPCILKPKVGNKKSLFDALFKVHGQQ